MSNASVDLSPVGLELRFTWTSRSDAASKLRHFDTSSRQARQQIFQLRQLYLQLTFTCPCVACEYVENKLRPVQNTAVYLAFQITLLRWTELVVEDDQVGVSVLRRRCHFFKLATTDQSCRIRPIAMLYELSRDLCPCARRQFAQLGH
jgi:hypothetical protein